MPAKKISAVVYHNNSLVICLDNQKAFGCPNTHKASSGLMNLPAETEHFDPTAEKSTYVPPSAAKAAANATTTHIEQLIFILLAPPYQRQVHRRAQDHCGGYVAPKAACR